MALLVILLRSWLVKLWWLNTAGGGVMLCCDSDPWNIDWFAFFDPPHTQILVLHAWRSKTRSEQYQLCFVRKFIWWLLYATMMLYDAHDAKCIMKCTAKTHARLLCQCLVTMLTKVGRSSENYREITFECLVFFAFWWDFFYRCLIAFLLQL